MLYGGINILKEESRIVIIGDDNKLYIKHDIIVKNKINDLQYILKSLNESGITPEKIFFSIDPEFVENSETLSMYFKVFSKSDYELRIINTVVKGSNNIVVTKSRGADVVATSSAIYLKNFFYEQHRFTDTNYTMMFFLSSIFYISFSLLVFAIFLTMSIYFIVLGVYFAILHFFVGLVGMIITINKIVNYKKLLNYPIYKIDKNGLTIFVELTLFNIKKLDTPCFMPWNDIISIEKYRPLIRTNNSNSWRARIYTTNSYKYYANGRARNKHIFSLDQFNDDEISNFKTLLVYWKTFKSIQ